MVRTLSLYSINIKQFISICVFSCLFMIILYIVIYNKLTDDKSFDASFFENSTLLRIHCKPPRFSPVDLPATGLVSFPGSGNTWLRYLVQEASGILTGSEYTDIDLLQDSFPAEGITNSSTILVKTHDSNEKTREKYSRVILLIRNPIEVILAEFNREYGGGHQSTASVESFHKYWKNFSKMLEKGWHSFHTEWLKCEKPLLIVQYDDLLYKTEKQLGRISAFLNIPFTHKGKLCAIFKGKQLKRPHSTPPLTLYNSQKLRQLNELYHVTVNVYENKLQHMHWKQ